MSPSSARKPSNMNGLERKYKKINTLIQCVLFRFESWKRQEVSFHQRNFVFLLNHSECFFAQSTTHIRGERHSPESGAQRMQPPVGPGGGCCSEFRPTARPAFTPTDLPQIWHTTLTCTENNSASFHFFFFCLFFVALLLTCASSEKQSPDDEDEVPNLKHCKRLTDILLQEESHFKHTGCRSW